MAKSKKQTIIKMQSTESHHFYTRSVNKKNVVNKLEKKMYDPVVRKHVMYKEKKLK